MTALDRSSPEVYPRWTESRVQSGRRDVGTGLFQRVFFVDVFDEAKGQALVRTLRLPEGPTNIAQVLSTGHEVALEEDRAATLLVPVSGRIFCALGPRDLTARPGQVMVLPRGRRRTVTLRDGEAPYNAFVLRLPGLSAGAPLAAGAVLNLDCLPDLAAAAQLVAGLVSPGFLPPEVLMARLRAAETLVDGALSALAAEPGARMLIAREDRALRRAEALLREHFAEGITIRDIADQAGLGMRQMQHLFARVHGLSPHAWLTRLRLEQAHLRLKGAHPAPSVTDAALAAGFSHLGRFPAVYRSRFGALPSAERATLP